MRTIVYGAGAIGGVVGGRLFEHGHDVVLIARGAHGETIASRGLTLSSPDNEVTLRVPVVSHPKELSFTEGDVVVLAMKSQDTRDAVESLAVHATSALPIICAQNGVENERVALRHFDNVYGMCVMCPASHLAPGRVVASSEPVTGLMDLGRWPSGTDATARELASAMSASTFVAEAREDIARWKWGKLLMNLGNAVEAVCGTDAGAGALMDRVHLEGVACLEAARVAYVSEEEDAGRRGDLLSVRPVGGHRRGGGSTWQSLTRATGSVETDYLTGEVVLLGRLTGVPTPLNEALQSMANEMARLGEPPGARSADDVLARVA